MRIEVAGTEELRRMLTGLTAKLQNKAVRQAVRKGGNIILGASKADARAMIGGRYTKKYRHIAGDTGRLIADSLQLRAFKKQKRGSFGMSVGTDPKDNDRLVYQAKKKSRYGDGRTFIPLAIEYGHIAPDNSFVGPIPFMRSAAQSQGEGALNAVITELRNGIEQTAKDQ